MIKQAIILTAGLGSRFFPATKAVPKSMLPVGTKPVIQHLVEEAVDSGMTEIIIVTSPGQDAVRHHFNPNNALEKELIARGKHALVDDIKRIEQLAHFTFIEQPEPRGDGDAILQARDALGSEPFAVLFGDDLIANEVLALRQLLTLYKDVQAPVICCERVEDVTHYGIVDPAEGTRVQGLVEKPSAEAAPSNIGVIGKYICTPDVLDALASSTASHHDGDLRLIDGLQALLAQQKPVHYLEVHGTRFDTGQPEGWLAANLHFGS